MLSGACDAPPVFAARKVLECDLVEDIRRTLQLRFQGETVARGLDGNVGYRVQARRPVYCAAWFAQVSRGARKAVASYSAETLRVKPHQERNPYLKAMLYSEDVAQPEHAVGRQRWYIRTCLYLRPAEVALCDDDVEDGGSERLHEGVEYQEGKF